MLIFSASELQIPMSKAANNAQQLPSLGEGLGVGSPLTSPSLNREGRGGSLAGEGLHLKEHLLPVLYVYLSLHGQAHALALQVVERGGSVGLGGGGAVDACDNRCVAPDDDPFVDDACATHTEITENLMS